MDDAIFQEAWARYLDEVSPACAHWVGMDFKPIEGCEGKSINLGIML